MDVKIAPFRSRVDGAGCISLRYKQEAAIFSKRRVREIASDSPPKREQEFPSVCAETANERQGTTSPQTIDPSQFRIQPPRACALSDRREPRSVQSEPVRRRPRSAAEREPSERPRHRERTSPTQQPCTFPTRLAKSFHALLERTVDRLARRFRR